MDLETIEQVIAVLTHKRKEYDEKQDWYAVGVTLELMQVVLSMYEFELLKQAVIVSNAAAEETTAIIRRIMRDE